MHQLKKTNLPAKIALASLGISLWFLVPHQASHSAALADLDPEVVANSWEEEDARLASVTLNGKELIRLRNRDQLASCASGASTVLSVASAATATSAENMAEDIAARLDDLVKNNKFDAEKLFPVKDGSRVIIRLDGSTVVSFPADQLAVAGKSEDKDSAKMGDTEQDSSESAASPSAFEQSLKIVNAIRTTFGASTIPQSYLKLSEIAQQAQQGQQEPSKPLAARAVGRFSGAASWYGPNFHGKRTSDGTRFDQEGLTAAHRSLPFGTRLLVTNRRTGDSCVVKVNDRGPFIDGRVIDLSKGAARQLNMIGSGVAMVDCLVLGQN